MKSTTGLGPPPFVLPCLASETICATRRAAMMAAHRLDGASEALHGLCPADRWADASTRSFMYSRSFRIERHAAARPPQQVGHKPTRIVMKGLGVLLAAELIEHVPRGRKKDAGRREPLWRQ